jgi:hypothetical protein
MLNEGNQIHNFISSYGSGSISQKVMVPTVRFHNAGSGFVTFWSGFGYADPYLSGDKKKSVFFSKFFAHLLSVGTFTLVSNTNSLNT